MNTFSCLAGDALPTALTGAGAAAAAEAAAKNDGHSNPHAADTAKKGACYKKIAAKYREKELGEKEAITQMTTIPKLTRADGSDEGHTNIRTKDRRALSNIARWVSHWPDDMSGMAAHPGLRA